MFCEKCNSALPSEGYICTNCGTIMTKSQIEMQKKINEENKKKSKPSYMSEKFGSNREFELNTNKDASIIKISIALVGIMALFVILTLLFV